MDYHTEPVNLRPCPSDYEPGNFFLESATGFLAPTYMDKAQKIEKKYGSGFIQQWAWEAEKLRKDMGLKEEYGEAMYFYGHHGRPSLIGMSTKMSEIYRSAFLRALAWFSKSGKIPSECFLDYSLSACPIDLTFWEVRPQKPPDWWPALTSKSKGSIDTSTGEAWQSLEGLVNRFGLERSANNRKILAACGSVKPAEGWIPDKLNIDFTMLGFAYRVKGASLPKAEEVHDNLSYGPVWFTAVNSSKPLCLFESTKEHYCTMGLEVFSIEDLVIMPLVAGLKANSINLWQCFRDFYSLKGLSYGLVCKGAILTHKHNGWAYTFEGKDVAFGYNWLSAIVERHDKDLPIPSGQVLEIDEKWLHDILEHEKFKLGYVIKVTSRVKEYRYGEAKILEDAKLFGVSPIILLP